MKTLAKLSVLMTAVLCIMVPGIGFAANEDPLFCACVPVNDDGAALADLEKACSFEATANRYARWRLRAPQKGEVFKEFVIPACNASINGVVVCQGNGTLDGLAEPLVCAGAPAEKILIPK